MTYFLICIFIPQRYKKCTESARFGAYYKIVFRYDFTAFKRPTQGSIVF